MGCYTGFNCELFTGFFYEQCGFYKGLNKDSIQDSTWVAGNGFNWELSTGCCYEQF